MNQKSTKLLLFSMVAIAYLVLIGVTIYSYSNIDEDLPLDLPKIVVLIPAVMTLMIPLTYGMLLFAIPDNPRARATVILGGCMALGLIGLSVAVYAFAS